jgi:hypothetical protein
VGGMRSAYIILVVKSEWKRTMVQWRAVVNTAVNIHIQKKWDISWLACEVPISVTVMIVLSAVGGEVTGYYIRRNVAVCSLQLTVRSAQWGPEPVWPWWQGKMSLLLPGIKTRPHSTWTWLHCLMWDECYAAVTRSHGANW